MAKPETMRAFCGYTGEGFVLYDMEKCYIITDSRYELQAHEQTSDAVVSVVSNRRNHFQILSDLINERSIKSLVFEDGFWTINDYNLLKKALPLVRLIPVGEGLTKWRMKKTESEVSRIRKAAKIADKSFVDALSFLHEGISEKEAAWKLEQALRNNGANGLSFDIIMAFGENGAKPHAIPGDRKLTYGDLVVMDFGCKYDGYCSDMTRTVGFGNIDDFSKRVYQIVLDAQIAAFQAIKPGVTGEEVDRVAREIIGKNGFGDYFGHGLGHGVGLEIHELPRLAPGTTGQIVLEAGHVVTDEPGVYIPGKFGIRIEDLCLVTDDGAERLSNSVKELTIIQHS